MKRQCALGTVVLSLASMSMSPASAAPREIEDFCFEEARHVTLPHRRGAGEAFMATCIANLTPVRTKTRKYRRY
jgi:hypothetical protein